MILQNNMSDGISSARLEFDVTAVAGIACPACRGDLRVDADRVVCTKCSHRYPIVDGIPVLIVERAEGGDPAR
jgi:uncharacterized protein YbaR (Trm112 family)